MTENAAVIENIQRADAITQGTAALVKASGENSRDHGFHEDWPTARHWDYQHPDERSAIRRAIAEKLALIHEEVSEALGEIRSGHAPLEVYFVDHKGVLGEKGKRYEEQQYNEAGVPQCKPEGFLVELADANIRIADLTYLAGDVDGTHLAQATAIKAEYNRTRPRKHGREF
jgi:hypothetical protein